MVKICPGFTPLLWKPLGPKAGWGVYELLFCGCDRTRGQQQRKGEFILLWFR